MSKKPRNFQASPKPSPSRKPKAATETPKLAGPPAKPVAALGQAPDTSFLDGLGAGTPRQLADPRRELVDPVGRGWVRSMRGAPEA
jgi:hypothetical protein